jgi:hypothetical protein
MEMTLHDWFDVCCPLIGAGLWVLGFMAWQKWKMKLRGR